ncbi:MAG: electron transfer flavoprotein subunit beta [Deltaproteobacteria bacterium]|nr:electron transfer flavoprotein subunit beta [Deltaproteobacteria bacterium]
MSNAYSIIVCAGLAPDPLQRLEPMDTPTGPALKNEMMLPAVLDPWAACALYEADNLAKKLPGSKVYLVSMALKTKLQQVMMVLSQKVPFELVAIDGPSNGFTDARECASELAQAIEAIPGLDKDKMLLFGGWESATRAAGATMQILGEKLGVVDQFQGVDKIEIEPSGAIKLWERVEGGKQQVSLCESAPVMVGWATGELPEPPNNPQVGMANMRTVMPALQKAKSAAASSSALKFKGVTLPAQVRETRIEKDMPVEAIAQELVTWIRGN